MLVLVAVVVLIEVASPDVHNNLSDFLDAIADKLGTHRPRPADPASFLYWGAFYLGNLAGVLAGEWLACRLIGRYFMAAASKVRLIHLVSNPWI